MLMLMALPRFGGEAHFADPLGGSAGAGGSGMVCWYALR